jgi:hypothetical protein
VTGNRVPIPRGGFPGSLFQDNRRR